MSRRSSTESDLSFAWDPAKSASTRLKHDVDFIEAQAIWRAPDRAVVDSKNATEPRQLTIGALNSKLRDHNDEEGCG